MLLEVVLVFILSVLSTNAGSELQPDDGSCILEHYLGTSWQPKGRLSFSINAINYEPVEMDLQRTKLVEYFGRLDSFYQFRLKCIKSNIAASSNVANDEPSNDTSENANVYYVQSYLKGCALLHSGLREKLFVSLTPSRHVKGIHAKLETDGSHCNPQFLSVSAIIPTEFSTTVAYFAHAPSPTPDTASYLDKLEAEKRERLMNPPDNRGFLQKYWMYILPAVLILFMNSQANQGGGGR